MIEINLVEQKKATKAPTVMGLDLAKVNVKLIVFAIVVLYVPDYTIYPMWEEEKASINKQTEKLNEELKVVQKDLEGSDKLRKELDAYNEQAEKLKQRSQQIDQILKVRTNPKKILERLARAVPKDLWFDTLVITPDKILGIKGAANNYKSIGSFIAASNESPFFGKTVVLKESKTKEETVNGRAERVEEFVVEAKIEVFDPF